MPSQSTIEGAAVSDPDFFAWLRQAPKYLTLAVGREPGPVRVTISYVASGHGQDYTVYVDDVTGQPTTGARLPGGPMSVVDPADLVLARQLVDVEIELLRAAAIPGQAKELGQRIGRKRNPYLRTILSKLRRLELLNHERAGYVLSNRGRRVLSLV